MYLLEQQQNDMGAGVADSESAWYVVLPGKLSSFSPDLYLEVFRSIVEVDDAAVQKLLTGLFYLYEKETQFYV